MKLFVTGTRGIPHIQGGIETHCQELYPRVSQYGWKITLATRRAYVDTGLKQYKGVRLIPLPSPQVKGLEALVHTFIAILYARLKGFRLLHIHAIGPSIFVPLARMLGFHVVVTNHGQDYMRKKWGMVGKAILKLGEMLGCRCAHRIIAVSHEIERCIERKYGRHDVAVIPNGVTIRARSGKTDFIESFGLETGKYILGVGRFVPEKGFHDLVEAFGRLGNGEIRCILAGDADPETSYSHALKSAARQKGCILAGFCEGEVLHQLYSHARLFILPSYHEGLSIALLDALSLKCRVLVSDIKANREIGLPDGCYFKTGDIDELAVKIKDAVRGRILLPSEDILHKRYDWDSIAEKTHKILVEIYH